MVCLTFRDALELGIEENTAWLAHRRLLDHPLIRNRG